MKKVIIIGGGFAGLASLFRLSRYKKRFDLAITLISDREQVNFLPMLPDCLGRSVKTKHLLFNLADLSAKKYFNLLKSRVIAVDLKKKEVVTSGQSLNYDFLIISSGTETNFYGNNMAREHSFKLDSVEDAAFLFEALEKNSYAAYLIAGGGYTGIEVATNLRVYLEKRKIGRKIVIIERAPAILGPLPQWLKNCVEDNLKRLDIEVIVNSTIEKIETESTSLADGRTFNHAMLIWAAGVRTADFIQNLEVEKNPQGRIKVDEYLRVNDACFAAGDTAYFLYKHNFLRMAVQFAIAQGACSAKNIIRSLAGKRLIEYKAADLGLIVPMANNHGCGRILGMKMRGFLPVFFHYFMCIYRSYGFKNKIGIIKDLVTGNA
ncbi:MAG: FAD-dependent oxidoreductase [Candidatus Omnitrophota bacterium]|nr:FAD-dependent oxidoreductase [Candidatus Omnitrophota bacterium]